MVPFISRIGAIPRKGTELLWKRFVKILARWLSKPVLLLFNGLLARVAPLFAFQTTHPDVLLNR